MEELYRLPDWSLGGGYAVQIEVDSDLDLTASQVTLLIFDNSTLKTEKNYDVSLDEDGVGTYDILVSSDDLPDTAKEYSYYLWLKYSGVASPLLLEYGRIECIAAQAPSAA